MTGEPRTLAGRYVLGEIVGSGGVADVHRAHDLVLERPVAVKMLRESAAAPADRVRFTSEVGLLAGLNHRGLVTVLDAGTTEDDQPYLVMELIEGPTLRQVMNQGPMSADKVADVGAQVAAALAYAHAQHVVHRDVKPGNVLIDARGRVRLADFGIARVIGDTVHHTRTGEAVGTVAYLSPEQVLGQEVDGAADVYALGLVLLEAFTAQRAFPGPTTDSAFARVARGPHLPDTLPPGWRRLLGAMTDADPAARPSAADVARELWMTPNGDLTGYDVDARTQQRSRVAVAAPLRLPVPSGPGPVAAVRPAAAPRHLVGAGGVVIVLAMLIAGAIISTPDPSESQAQARTTPTPTSSARPAAVSTPIPARRPASASAATGSWAASARATPEPTVASVAKQPTRTSPGKSAQSATKQGKGHHKKASKAKKHKKAKGKGKKKR